MNHKKAVDIKNIEEKNEGGGGHNTKKTPAESVKTKYVHGKCSWKRSSHSFLYIIIV